MPTHRWGFDPDPTAVKPAETEDVIDLSCADEEDIMDANAPFTSASAAPCKGTDVARDAASATTSSLSITVTIA